MVLLILFLLLILFMLTYVLMYVHFVSSLPGPTEPTCLDWTDSVPSGGAASVVAGQVGWLSCPLLPSSVHSTSHAFTWYRLPWGHEEEQPITPRYRSHRDLYEGLGEGGFERGSP